MIPWIKVYDNPYKYELTPSPNRFKQATHHIYIKLMPKTTSSYETNILKSL